MGLRNGIVMIILNVSVVLGSPLVYEKMSPSGRSAIAIASSGPEFGRSFSDGASASASASASAAGGPKQLGGHVQSFSFAAPGRTVVGSGRSFDSASDYSPYFSSFFNWPLDFDDFNPYQSASKDDYLKSVESFFDNYKGHGDDGTVTTINDNGHIYGNIGKVTFDNRASPRADENHEKRQGKQ